MSFPHVFSGNPVLIDLIRYGCPTETFGRDRLKREVWATARVNLTFMFFYYGNAARPTIRKLKVK